MMAYNISNYQCEDRKKSTAGAELVPNEWNGGHETDCQIDTARAHYSCSYFPGLMPYREIANQRHRRTAKR
jgi:hypothetical protein